MQQIERYGVIALVFMLVTVVAVSFWDGGEVEPERDGAAQESRLAAAPAANAPVELARPRRLDAERDAAGLPLSRPAGSGDAARGSRADGRRVRGRLADDGRPDLTPGAAAARAGDQVPSTVRSEPVAATAAPELRASAPTRLVAPRRTEPAADAAREAVRLQRPVELETPREGRITAAAPPLRREGPEIVSSVAAVHEVRPGDTLERIASHALGDRSRWREIQELNGNIDPRRLIVGMQLRLPGGARTVDAPVVVPAALPAAAPAREGRPGRTYRVQPGDMLSRIAQRELGSAQRWKEIVALNPKVDPDRLFVGAELVLPGAEPERVARAEPAKRTEKDKGLRLAQSSGAGEGPYRVR